MKESERTEDLKGRVCQEEEWTGGVTSSNREAERSGHKVTPPTGSHPEDKFFELTEVSQTFSCTDPQQRFSSKTCSNFMNLCLRKLHARILSIMYIQNHFYGAPVASSLHSTQEQDRFCGVPGASRLCST